MNNFTVPKSILLVAANPKGTVNLRLQEEEREIKERLRVAGYGKIPINSTGATRTRDFAQAMVDFKPQIVHFCGHGAGEDGLVFEDLNGQGQLVSSEALTSLFQLFSSYVECVVLNACYSKFQARAIAQSINYVIGMNQGINDRAAIEFSVGFYTGLGGGETPEFSYKLGCSAIQLAGIPGHSTPQLFRGGEIMKINPVNFTSDGETTISQDDQRNSPIANIFGASRSIQVAYKKTTEEIKQIRAKTKQKGGFWIFEKHRYTIEDLLESVHHKKIYSITEKLGSDVQNWYRSGKLSDGEEEIYHNVRNQIKRELDEANVEILLREPTWLEEISKVLERFIKIVMNNLPIISRGSLSGQNETKKLPPGSDNKRR
jgi:hypothetical protein